MKTKQVTKLISLLIAVCLFAVIMRLSCFDIFMRITGVKVYEAKADQVRSVFKSVTGRELPADAAAEQAIVSDGPDGPGLLVRIRGEVKDVNDWVRVYKDKPVVTLIDEEEAKNIIENELPSPLPYPLWYESRSGIKIFESETLSCGYLLIGDGFRGNNFKVLTCERTCVTYLYAHPATDY